MVRRAPRTGCLPQPLQDPLGDRQVATVPPPAAELFTSGNFFEESPSPRGGKLPRLAALRDHLLREGLLSQELALELITRAKDLFHEEPNLLKLKDPITVVGDIHGQFYDVASILELGGDLADNQYLFLGDYVDRGSFSVEVVFFLYAAKICYPKRVKMLRGNHESRQMTSFFNFRQEAEYKYDASMYEAVMDSFDSLPLAAVVNGQFLCVHGGLSPHLTKLKDITQADRFHEPPLQGLMCDLLWSDPTDEEGGDDWRENQVRSCAWFFTSMTANRFLKDNGLICVLRAHEVQIDGFKMHETNPSTGFPSVITIFSAPNYCDSYGNKGAILKLENDTLNVQQFNFNEHPYHLPDFMGIFEWSIPFVAEKVTTMLEAVLCAGGDEELMGLTPSDADLPQPTGRVRRTSLTKEENLSVELAQDLDRLGATERPVGGAAVEREESENASRARLRQKVWALGRLSRVLRTLRQEHETIVQLKGVCPGSRLAPGLLLAGRQRLKTELDLFAYTQSIDCVNERRPTLLDPDAAAACKGV